jgi:hypothetical protein
MNSKIDLDHLPEEMRESAAKSIKIMGIIGSVLQKEDSVTQSAVLAILIATWVAGHRDGKDERGDKPTDYGKEIRGRMLTSLMRSVITMVPGIMIESDRLEDMRHGKNNKDDQA